MKKFLFTLILFSLGFIPAFSQDSSATVPYQLVEVRPSFNGGDLPAFSKWVHASINYPEEAKLNGIQGRELVSFIVEPDGSVTNVTVLKGTHPSLDAEAVRVVSSSPKWTPGADAGKPVRVKVTFPLIFKIHPEKQAAATAPKTAASDDDPIPFQLVEVKPSFNGGDANEFAVWVNSLLVYPETAKKNGTQGRVTLQFTIETDGSLTNVKVLRGVDPEIDAEAVRVVKSSPRWVPGRQKDKDVRVTYTMPIIFQLK
ncbi:MAG: energy transducer TonB [Bacteroidales bacterium]|nr:energy transducer TonB [Bacteroidales bacterium]